jgi:hypothetical protein
MAKSARKKLKQKRKVSPEQLRRKLKLKHLEAKEKLSKSHPQVDKFFKSKKLDPGKVRSHSARILGAGAIAGAMLLKAPAGIKALPTPHEILDSLDLKKSKTATKAPREIIVDTLKSVLPKRPRPLTRVEEKFLEQIFQNVMGIASRGSLEGEHLNTTYGYIGAEQHLRRYPSDTLLQHGKGEMLDEGMAPGLGAWGYFAPSKADLTPYLEDVEKWYAVVQTLYLPGWNQRTRYLRDWYKYRKVLIVNVGNGRAVVASIADSGPAAWTGKHFGGSPEIMDYLGGPRYKKGKVVLFFVDDPENKIPLGPVKYTGIKSTVY